MKKPTTKCPACKGTGQVPDQAAIGADMMQLRKKAGVSSLQIAKRLGLGKSTLHALEHGQGTWTAERQKQYKDAIAFLKANPPERKQREAKAKR